MLKKYLLSSVARFPEDEGGTEKSPAEIEREKIAVTSSTDNPPKKEAEGAEGEETEGKEDEGDNKETDKEEAEDKDDEGESGEAAEDEIEKTPEQLAADKAKAKTKGEKDRVQRRIDREVAKRKTAEAERDALRAKVAANGEGSLTKEEAEALAEDKAKEIVAKKEFETACNNLNKAAIKADKDFTNKVNEMAEDIGPIPGAMIGILNDLENGGKVLAHLASNVDEAERLYALSPMKMAVELTQLSVSLKAKEKKPVSKVPAPNEAIHGSGRTQEVALNDKMSTDDWIAKRNADVARKRAVRPNLR